MEFYEVVKTRRSIRSFKTDTIDDDVIKRVLEAARLAPSGRNSQPWKFILIADSEKKRDLVKACGNQEFIGEAPIIVVSCGRDIQYNRGGYMKEMSFLVDISIAFTHLILAARAEGLGTCWIGNFENEEVKKILGIPEGFQVVAVTPMGYPKDDSFKETTRRKTISEITSFNNF